MHNKPFRNYFGGKSGAGTYQHIINHIPPHRVRYILFAGNCGVHYNLRPAEFHIINDLDSDVMKAWDATGLGVRGDYRLYNKDTIEFLKTDLLEAEYQRQKKHSFIYLDPTYLVETLTGQLPIYKYTMTTEQHVELLTIINTLSDFKIMISHYACPLYDTMLKGWTRYDFKNKTRQKVHIESIYYNYELDGHLHDYQYIGGNFRERETYKRQKVNLIKKLDQMEPTLRYALLDEIDLQYRNKNR